MPASIFILTPVSSNAGPERIIAGKSASKMWTATHNSLYNECLQNLLLLRQYRNEESMARWGWCFLALLGAQLIYGENMYVFFELV